MREAEAESDELFEMANLFRARRIGHDRLGQPAGNARHDVRVKVDLTTASRLTLPTRGRRRSPTPDVIAGHLSPDDRQAVFEWVSLNTAALVAYWEAALTLSS